MRTPSLLRFAPVLVLTASCAQLAAFGQGPNSPGGLTRPPPPNIRVVDVRLVDSPTETQIGMHYCHTELSPLLCGVIGPRPSEADLRFAFDLELEIDNPADIPLPLVQALVGFTVFPQSQSTENLGSVCMSFCETGTSCQDDAQNACHSTEPEIRTAEDFAQAAVGFLISTAMQERSIEELRIRTIEPGEHIRMVVRLELATEQIVRIIEEVAHDAFSSVQRGQIPDLRIPYTLEGSVWVTVEGFGRFAAGFGPLAGEWDLAQ